MTTPKHSKLKYLLCLIMILWQADVADAQVVTYDRINLDKKEDSLYLKNLVMKGYQNLEKLTKLSNSTQKDSSLLATYYFLARVYQNWNGKTDSLKKYSEKTIALSKTKRNIEHLIKGNIALEFYFQIKKGDFQKALALNFELLKMIEANIYYQNFKSKVYYNVGSIYMQLGDYSKAEQYLILAKIEYKTAGYPIDFYAVILQKLGNVLQNKGDLLSAEKNYTLAINELNDGPNELIKSYIYQDLGNLFVKQKNYKEALINYALAEEIFKKLRKSKAIIELNADILNVYFDKKEYEKVISMGESIIKTSQTRPVLIKTLEKLEKIYEEQGKYELAYKKLKYRKWLEELNKTDETQKEISKIQADYDMQLKDSQNYTELQKQTVLNQKIITENEILRLKTEFEKQIFIQQNIERDLKSKLEKDRVENDISNIRNQEQAAINSLKLEKMQQKVQLEERRKKYVWFVLAFLMILGFAILWFQKKQTFQKLNYQRITSKLEQQIAETEIAALRSQMNPHFIFNCLNSIKLYSLENDSESASAYLTKFSKLIRLVLDNSRSERLTLEKEIETLRLYIEMEIMRFKEKVTYEMIISPEVDLQYIEIPPLLIQPFVENAIWHGLMHKEFGGKVSILVNLLIENMLEIQIIDNGVGREKSAEYKSKTATKHKSFGMKVTNERIELINQIYKTDAKVEIEDLYDDTKCGIGTKVTIQIPI